MILIVLISLILLTYTKTITVAPNGNTETADYYCDGFEDEYEIQKAICELKEYDIDTDYDTCGKYNAYPDGVSEEVKLKGGIIHLLQGTFNVTQNIRIYSNIIFEGEGIDLTTIRLDTRDELPNSGILRMDATDNNIIQDFTIDGNKDSEVFDSSSVTSKYRYGVYTQDSSRIHMRRVRAYNCPGYGFDPHGVPGEAKSTDYMIIENCYAEDNNLDGFTVDKSYYVTVTNNWAINNHRNGFELTTGAVGVHITNNHAIGNGIVYDTGACGIKIQDQYNADAYWGTQYSTVSNNYIENSGTDGICVVESARTVIDSNIIITSGEHCIRLRDTSYDNIDSQQGSDDSIVSNNLCVDNTYGIAIEDSDGVTVIGNRVKLSTLNSDYGIVIKRTTNSLVTSNNLCETNGVDVQSSSSNVLESNNLVCETTSSPTKSPTPSPTVEGQTPSPTKSPTPAPTVDLNNIVPQEVILISDESINYDADNDRIFDTWKEPNGDFVTTDLSAWGDGYKLISGTACTMRIYLPDASSGYYPERFELTSMSTNNNHGIIFNWPSEGWIDGWNEVTRVIELGDYYGFPDWTDVDRFQLYYSDAGEWNFSGNKQLTLDYLKCGNPDYWTTRRRLEEEVDSNSEVVREQHILDDVHELKTITSFNLTFLIIIFIILVLVLVKLYKKMNKRSGDVELQSRESSQFNHV